LTDLLSQAHLFLLLMADKRKRWAARGLLGCHVKEVSHRLDLLCQALNKPLDMLICSHVTVDGRDEGREGEGNRQLCGGEAKMATRIR
jgi:hypothetical protein